MKQIRKRLTYANVMSSIAVFLMLGGATAFAANHLGKNSVGSKQLKKNAVTAKKIKKNAVTTNKIKKNAVNGAKVNEATLGTVPSANAANTAKTATVANTANTANSASTAGTASNVVGRIPVSRFLSEGVHEIATVGPFTIRAECTIDNLGDDEGRFLLYTAVDGASMDDNNGDEWEVFNTEQNPAELYEESTTTGQPDIEVAGQPGLTAVAPDGTALVFGNETIGFNIAGHPGQCYFGGMIQKIG